MPDNYIQISTDKGTVHISEQVIAVISGAAVKEVEGAAGFANTSGSELYEFLGKKPASRGIHVSFEDNQVTVSVIIMVKYGYAIAKVASDAQKAIVSALESMTGITPTVNVSVTGIAFPKK